MIGAKPASLQAAVPAYLYEQYSDDDDLQAIFGAHNSIIQGYIDWFNQINLPVYTGLSGSLLDWVCTGLYGLPRPIIPTQAGPGIGLLETYPYNSLEFNQFFTAATQTFYTVSDDIYKRILTWIFFKGDGAQFTIPWLKRRVMRFLAGQDGTSSATGTVNINGLTLPANIQDFRSSPGSYVTQDRHVSLAPAGVPRVDWSDGGPDLLIEDAATNQVCYSAMIGGLQWSVDGGTEVFLGRPEKVAPDLSTNATMITETASLTQHLVQSGTGIANPGVGTIETHSVYAAPLAGAGKLYMTSFGEAGALFDLINGIAPAPAGGQLSTGMLPMADGWWRCWVTWAKGNAHAGYYLGVGSSDGHSPVPYVGNPANQVYVWGAQREEGQLSSYVPTTNTPVIRAADIVSYPSWIDQTNPVSIQVLNGQITITITGYDALKPLFAAAIASGVLPLPPMYTYVVE